MKRIEKVHMEWDSDSCFIEAIERAFDILQYDKRVKMVMITLTLFREEKVIAAVTFQNKGWSIKATSSEFGMYVADKVSYFYGDIEVYFELLQAGY